MELNPAFRDYSERTEKLDKVLRELRSKGIFSALQGWREEVKEANTVTVIEVLISVFFLCFSVL